ncbi:MAG: SGNH/GDSL hydrolase family protein [Verrucomicrobia bacterium]|nr:SGNH/GDSL hydrolase family protein [Verrucomicrobiota bacterium]
MKLRLAIAALLIVSLVAAVAQTPKPQDVSKPKNPPKVAKKAPAMELVTDLPGLPRVLLIGDSISIGYTVPVRDLLKGKVNVHRIPENGGPTTNGTAKLGKWLGTSKWDVIHFNWGLHDLKFMETGKVQVSLEDYENNLRELVKQLKQTNARLIWCATTPAPDAKLSPPRKDSDVRAYNASARKVMDENKIPINDLYAHTLPKLADVQLPANVHFKKEGYEFLAKQVARSIEESLAKR